LEQIINYSENIGINSVSELQSFNFQNNEVRTIMIDDNPWFIARDVCMILGLANTPQAVSKLEEDEKLIYKLYISGQNRDVNLINEYGLYSLTMTSNKQEAKEFKHWVTHEILPTIRKTGGYVANEDLFINTYLPFADDNTKAMFKGVLEVVKSQNKMIEESKPKVLLADSIAASGDSILIGDLAKLLKQNGINIGRDRLFEWLRNNDYLGSFGNNYNKPSQRAMELGLFELKEHAITTQYGTTKLNFTTMVTGKGQKYFINKFLAKNQLN
jgi:anti-repressor protein